MEVKILTFPFQVEVVNSSNQFSKFSLRKTFVIKISLILVLFMIVQYLTSMQQILEFNVSKSFLLFS